MLRLCGSAIGRWNSFGCLLGLKEAFFFFLQVRCNMCWSHSDDEGGERERWGLDGQARKCLFIKHEVLTSGPQKLHNNQAWWCASVTLVLREQRQMDPGGQLYWPARSTETGCSDIVEKVFLKILRQGMRKEDTWH